MLRKIKKRYWIAAPLIILILSYLFIVPKVVQRILPSLVEDYGFKSLTIRNLDFSYNSLIIDDLSMEYSKGSEAIINIQKIEFNYQILELLSGKINKLSIKQPKVYIKGKKQSSPTQYKIDLLKTYSSFDSILPIKVPIDSVNISDLQLYNEDSGNIFSGDIEFFQKGIKSNEIYINGQSKLLDKKDISIELSNTQKDINIAIILQKETIINGQIKKQNKQIELLGEVVLNDSFIWIARKFLGVESLKESFQSGKTQIKLVLNNLGYLTSSLITNIYDVNYKQNKAKEISILTKINFEQFIDLSALPIASIEANIYDLEKKGNKLEQIKTTGTVSLKEKDLSYNGSLDIINYRYKEKQILDSLQVGFEKIDFTTDRINIDHPEVIVKKINYDNYQLESGLLKLKGILFKYKGNKKITLLPSKSPVIGLNGLSFDKVSLSPVNLSLQSPLVINFKGSQYQAINTTVMIDPITINHESNSLDISDALLDLSIASNKMLLDFHWKQAVLNHDLGSYHLNKNKLSTSFILLEDLRKKLSINYKTLWQETNAPIIFDIDINQGSSGLSGKGVIKTSINYNDQILNKLGITGYLELLQTKIENGNLVLSIPIILKNNNKIISADYKLSGVNGYLYGAKVDNLSAYGKIEILPKIRTYKDSIIKVNNVNIGIDLQNISTGLDLTPSKAGHLPIVLLRNPKLEVFSGSIKTPKIRLDLNRPSSKFVLAVKRIDLKSIAEVRDLDGLTMTGYISGELPVYISNKEIEVRSGVLKSEESGGTLSYKSPTDGLAASSQLEVTLKALENYKYRNIKAKVDYDKDGLLMLGIEAKGKSPEISSDQEVHLNINLEENLKKLFFSLKLINDQDNPFNEKIRQYFLQKK